LFLTANNTIYSKGVDISTSDTKPINNKRGRCVRL